eukprot:scaffold257850_cov24-Prasinocladus_malaysianus.AAC.1
MDGYSPNSVYADEEQAISIHTVALKARLPSVGMQIAIKRCQYVYWQQLVEERQYTYRRNQHPSLRIRRYACCQY